MITTEDNVMTEVANGQRQLVTPGLKKKRIPVALVIYRTLDPDAKEVAWDIVPPEEVPAWLKEERIVRAMVDGQMVQKEYRDKYWYRAEQVVIH